MKKVCITLVSMREVVGVLWHSVLSCCSQVNAVYPFSQLRLFPFVIAVVVGEGVVVVQHVVHLMVDVCKDHRVELTPLECIQDGLLGIPYVSLNVVLGNGVLFLFIGVEEASVVVGVRLSILPKITLPVVIVHLGDKI